MADLHVSVRPQGRWGEVRIHWTTVDGPDSSLIYLPIEDAREMERKLGSRIVLHPTLRVVEGREIAINGLLRAEERRSEASLAEASRFEDEGVSPMSP